MKQLLLLNLLLFAPFAWSAENITGFWTSIDDTTHEPKSIVHIYENNGILYGRVVKLFKNRERTAPSVRGNPKIEGLDIIWDMKENDKKWSSGKILDPVKGKHYNCELWKEGENLIVRGKIGPFGRNQLWLPAKPEEIPQHIKESIPSPHIPFLEN